jgi:hypothetical protein
MNNTGIFYLTQILILKKFEKEIVFECSVLAWIRIRITSIRIHNPEKNKQPDLYPKFFDLYEF